MANEPNSDIERGYIEQGYQLPSGLTWEDVARSRARWDIAPQMVPVCVSAHAVPAGVPANAVIGWGVPIINGRYLRHGLYEQA